MSRTADDISVRIKESVKFIRSKVKLRPKVGIILGSGLGDFAEHFSNKKIIPNDKIPHYPRSTVVGHHGKLIFGKLGRVVVLAFQGRVHLYETGNLETVLYPIHIAKKLGIKVLIVTNAAGAVNREFKAGDLMVLTDQINLTFENPLANFHFSKTRSQRGEDPAPRAGPMIAECVPWRLLYDIKLQQLMLRVAKEKGLSLQRGVYCGIKGPSYETAAEIEMIRRIEGDAVGMSTVNEVTLAVALGMRVAAISCITNLATGIAHEKLSHADVTEVAATVKESVSRLLKEVIHRMGRTKSQFQSRKQPRAGGR